MKLRQKLDASFAVRLPSVPRVCLLASTFFAAGCPDAPRSVLFQPFDQRRLPSALLRHPLNAPIPIPTRLRLQNPRRMPQSRNSLTLASAVAETGDADIDMCQLLHQKFPKKTTASELTYQVNISAFLFSVTPQVFNYRH
jgi:hypothetical protein